MSVIFSTQMGAGRSYISRIALAITSVIVSFGSAELFLRKFGYARTAPITLQFSGFDPLKDVIEDDPDVLWRFRANDDVSFSGFHFTTNAIGTRGPLPERAKPKDTLRIVCLGDSTAFGNWTTYAEQLQSILAEHTERKVEVINGGVPGYTSHQGYELFLHDLAAYQPDIVTWCFGFNNAKESAGGVPDARRLAVLDTFLGRLRFDLSRFRVFRVLEKRIGGLKPQDYAFTETGRDQPLRCPPAEHAELVEKMFTWAKSHGATFIPITQPHGFRSTALDMPGALGTEIPKMIRSRLEEQNEAVRTAATRAGSPFLDMAREFESITAFEPFTDPFPGGDSIHHNVLGIRAFATFLASYLSRGGVIATQSPIEFTTRVARFPFALACDVEGDELEEIVVGTFTDRLEIAIVDARTGATRKLDAKMQAPTRECSIQTMPILPERIAISTATNNGFRIDTVKESGEGGTTHLGFAPTGLGSRAVRILPFDKDADGRPEYALDFGRTMSDRIVVISDSGVPVATWRSPFDRKHSLSMTTHRGGKGKDFVVLSGLMNQKGAIFQDGPKGVPAFRTFVDYQLHDLPCVAIAGEFDARIPGFELMALRGPVLLSGIEYGQEVRFVFPTDLYRFDEEAPTLSATLLPEADRTRRRLLIASASETGVEVLVLDRDGLRPFAYLKPPQ
jgi:lysophospholipase L1-like esterase